MFKKIVENRLKLNEEEFNRKVELNTRNNRLSNYDRFLHKNIIPNKRLKSVTFINNKK